LAILLSSNQANQSACIGYHTLKATHTHQSNKSTTLLIGLSDLAFASLKLIYHSHTGFPFLITIVSDLPSPEYQNNHVFFKLDSILRA